MFAPCLLDVEQVERGEGEGEGETLSIDKFLCDEEAIVLQHTMQLFAPCVKDPLMV
jgi:hypothetical protein